MVKDQYVVDSIRSGDKRALDKVYLEYKGDFILFARQFHIGEDDISDIYQDSIITLYENVRSGKLQQLTSALKTYVFAIAKFKIYKLLKDKNLNIIDLHKLQDREEELEESAVEMTEERLQKMRYAYRQLGKKCREVLQLFYYEGQDVESIKTILNYTSKDVVKSQKSRCLKQLKNLIREENG